MLMKKVPAIAGAGEVFSCFPSADVRFCVQQILAHLDDKEEGWSEGRTTCLGKIEHNNEMNTQVPLEIRKIRIKSTL